MYSKDLFHIALFNILYTMIGRCAPAIVKHYLSQYAAHNYILSRLNAFHLCSYGRPLLFILSYNTCFKIF